MSLDNALADAVKSVPECVAGAYVDLESGMLLAMETTDSHSEDELDLVSAATAEMFQGPAAKQIRDQFNKDKSADEDDGYFQEFLVFSENLIHVFLRTKLYPDHVVAYVCRKSANIGIVLAKSRNSVDEVANAL